MADPAQTIEGWYALHDFRSIDWNSWKTADRRRQALDEWTSLCAAWQAETHAGKGSFAAYKIAGSKADFLLLHFRPTLADLIECKTRFDSTALADHTVKAYSYVSIVELSAYLSRASANPADDPRLAARLFPTPPEEGAVCFYPMNKRRSGNDNWYSLPMEDRQTMMASHGQIGRKYAGAVTQVITGSVGLDDWEWGVTLFANDPLQFKKLVYEMRFDEVSARFGEFGPFYVGQRVAPDRTQDLFSLSRT